MTWEEIQAGLAELVKDDKAAEPFKAFVKTLGFETPEDIQGLKDKNNEIFIKLRESKSKIDDMQKIIDKVDIDEYNALKEGRLAKLPDDVIKLRADLTSKFETDKNAILEEKNQINSKYEKLLVDLELSKALEVSGFTQNKLLLQQAFQGKAKVEKNGSKDTVVILDENDIPIPVMEHFKNFSATEFGKKYLDQPENKGANTQSIKSSGGGSKTMPRSEFDKLPDEQKLQFTRDGGTPV